MSSTDGFGKGKKEVNIEELSERKQIWRDYSKLASDMHFWDGMGREYAVDMEKEYKTWFKNPNLNGKGDVHYTKAFHKDVFSNKSKDLERLQKERE
jgi:hypothetical protein